MNKHTKQTYFTWFLSVVTLLLVFMLLHANGQLTIFASTDYHVKDHYISDTSVSKLDPTHIKKEISEDQEKKEPTKTISRSEIVKKTKQFMDILVQEIDDNYKVTHFNTKEELLDEFAHVAARDVAAEYVEFYYEEKSDGLYIIPTETPPWFQADKEYDMVQLDNNRVSVTQINTIDLYGTYTIEYEFTYEDGWIITNTTHS